MINVFGSSTGEEEQFALQNTLASNWIGPGPKVAQFETEFSQQLNLPGLVMTDSCTNSLYMAIRLLNLPPQSEIIVPSFTWVGCANAVLLAGHKVIFSDVDMATQNVNIDLLPITKHTKAIMVVHYAGLPVNIAPIMKIGLPIIEDAAHAVDSYIDGKVCGSFGDIGTYSFGAIKNLASPGSGGLTTSRAKYLEEGYALRHCGITESGFSGASHKLRWWEHEIQFISPKMMPNDISASIAIAQLHKLKLLQARRKKIWEAYQTELKDINWLVLPQDAAKNEQHSYFTYFTQVLNGRRDQLAEYLLENKVYTTLRFQPLHLNPIFGSGDFPNSEKLNKTGLNLPLHPNLSDDNVDKIISLIKNFATR